MPMFEKCYSRVHSPALGMMSFRGGRDAAGKGTNGQEHCVWEGVGQSPSGEKQGSLRPCDRREGKRKDA